MISYKLKITNSPDILKYQQEYAHILRKAYNNSNKIRDKNFIDSLVSNNFCKWIMSCAVGEAESNLKKTLANKKKNEDIVLKIEQRLKSESDKRIRYKLRKNYQYLIHLYLKTLFLAAKNYLKKFQENRTKKILRN